MYRPAASSKYCALYRRLARAADSYLDLSGPQLLDWRELRDASGLYNVAGTWFLRPYRPALRFAEPMRLARITGSIRKAAREGRIYHMWWHAHNFGIHRDENMRCSLSSGRILALPGFVRHAVFAMRDVPALSGAPVGDQLGMTA